MDPSEKTSPTLQILRAKPPFCAARSRHPTPIQSPHRHPFSLSSLPNSICFLALSPSLFHFNQLVLCRNESVPFRHPLTTTYESPSKLIVERIFVLFAPNTTCLNTPKPRVNNTPPAATLAMAGQSSRMGSASSLCLC